MRLRSAIQNFLATCRSRHLSSHTLSDYSGTLRRLLRQVGNRDVRCITLKHLETVLDCPHLASKTVRNFHIGLSAFYTWLCARGHVPKHLLHLIPRPKVTKVIIKPFDRGDLVALLRVCRWSRYALRDRAILLVLLDTGMRSSELCALQIEHWTSREIDIYNGKGDKQRTVPISAHTANALRAYLATRYKTLQNAPLFLSLDHTFLTRNGLRQLVRRLAQQAGVTYAFTHRFFD